MGHFVAGEEMGHFVAGTICRMGRKWDILSSGTICRPKNAGGTICRWNKMSPNPGWWLLAGYERVFRQLVFLCISFVNLYVFISLRTIEK